MVSAPPAPQRPPATVARDLPPVTPLAVTSMMLVIIGGIWMAAYIPRRVPLVVPVTVLVLAVVVLAAAVVSLARVPDFAWKTFFLVGRWALAAYVVVAGMLEYVFVYDDTRGAPLILLSLMLLVYAVDIPLILAFSVARYQPE